MRRRVLETLDKLRSSSQSASATQLMGNSRLLASVVKLYFGIVVESRGIKVDRTKEQMFAEVNGAELKMTKPALYQTTAKYGRSKLRKSLWQLFDTFVPYLMLWAFMVYTVQREFPYWITLTLALVAGGILVRIFILFHDCCHGSFFASRRGNTMLGYVTGILTFTPFQDWRHSHNRHHATAGNLDRRGTGDIRTMTTEEYLAAPLGRRFAYRFYRNPFILFGPGSLLLFLVLQRFSKKGGGKRERKSVLITNVALLLVVGVAARTIGLQTYLLIQLPVILIGGGLGLWLFYVQHQFEDAYWMRHQSWDPMSVALAGSSYFKLPKILQWFTGNIGLHHIHHVRPTIPNYNLQQCQDEIPALRAVKAITFLTSIRSLRLGLYDEKNKKLVSFRSLAMVGTGS
jgi:acyl-lipid omega-6 desaturase (Delta-12 desaturase)